MKVIGQGEKHRVAVDTSKNRMYFNLNGELMNFSAVKDVAEHVRQGCRQLSRGFTLLSDFREVGSLGLPDLVTGVMQVPNEAGVRKVAVVWSKEGFTKWVLDQTAERISKDYADRRRSFENVTEAEEWLDQ